jgi:hypothetical protein
MRRMRRRLTALFALASLLLGALLPAHAHGHPHASRDGPPVDDLCVAGKVAAGSPVAPDGIPVPACDMCGGCPGGHAALPRATPGALPSDSGARPAVAAIDSSLAAGAPRFRLARGPPLR